MSVWDTQNRRNYNLTTVSLILSHWTGILSLNTFLDTLNLICYFTDFLVKCCSCVFLLSIILSCDTMLCKALIVVLPQFLVNTATTLVLLVTFSRFFSMQVNITTIIQSVMGLTIPLRIFTQEWQRISQ